MSSADGTTARAIGKLTTIQVRQAKARGLYGDGGGLFLQISASGAKSWVFRYKQAGRLRVMGLGPIHTVSLAEAREKALACRKARLDGIDPIEQRRKRVSRRSLPRQRRSRSNKPPRPTSRRTKPAGAIRSMPRNGRRHSGRMPIP